MNHKEKRNLQKDWLFVTLATMIGFFVNLAASSTYSLYTSDFKWSILFVLVFSASFCIFAVGLFSFLIDDIDEFKSKDRTFNEVIKSYLNNWLSGLPKLSDKVNENIDISEYANVFHNLMIVILSRRALFKRFEKNLKGKADEYYIKHNTFVSYYTMDYTRGQLIDLRKFFENDSSSYKVSELVYCVADNDLTKLHKELYNMWKKNFRSATNKLIAHIDKDYKNVPNEITKKLLDEFIDEINDFLSKVINGLRANVALNIDESFRNKDGEFLNLRQQEEFNDFKKWICDGN